MGLDQFAYHCKPELLGSNQIDFDQILDRTTRTEFFYWRKHPDLHGWMEELYRSKGGVEEFNCVAVRLERADIDALNVAISDGDLPHTEVFFFGKSSYHVDKDERDLRFIFEARSLLTDRQAIYYWSSW